MSGGDQDERRFADTLASDLASDVLEDETACEEALKLGPDADGVLVRIQQAAARSIAEQRRERIATLWQRRAAVTHQGRYNELTRVDLLRLVQEREAAIEHRDLTNVPDEDLRTLLEDLDAVQDDSGSEE